MSIIEKRPPGPTGEALSEKVSRHFDSASLRKNQQIPSRATLARKWPRLKINRFSGRWVDDATGARGDAIETLLSYIAGGEK